MEEYREVSREEVSALSEDYAEIMRKESHHDHKIYEDKHGTYRWATVQVVDDLVEVVGLNQVVESLFFKGYDKNSELYREIYRSIGYSISGYWEIFYWEANNEDASEY